MALANEKSNRNERRKARTRRQLIDAARRLFARQGVDATAINQITEEADLGFGSFYNYFSSKEEIVAAVLRETMTAHGETISRLTVPLEDPAEVLAVAHRYLAALARSEPETAWLLVRLEPTHQVLGALRPYAEHDVERGLAAGRFVVADKAVAIRAMGGALLGVMRGMLDGELGEEAPIAHAEGVLRALGLDRQGAAEVAARPLPRSSSSTVTADGSDNRGSMLRPFREEPK